MAFIDSLIGILIIGTFFFFIGSKIYEHEKEHLDPLIKKVKDWLSPPEPDEFFDPMDDFEINYRGHSNF